ncbi:MULTISPECIES: phosphocarrier protein HPr [Lysinibacillus]|uniref:Phosphocarrier protein HPr n=1 Tax=Lysinibacillus antri TaxID=2498145 RepID=A0A432LC68_9BACI|nr:MULTISPECIES: phosphocarrier protein HPr [Lysinibacillus]RUL52238.1 phosphocarrier protein HPr [Lysinibacillus antri]TSI05187.1 phosphocarrier protein HPr [Lysinibacillus sp. BW-2-10]
MIAKNYTITSEQGIHARPATVIVGALTNFKSEVKIEYKGKQANLKSIMGVMALGVPNGATITITADGEDEAQVIEKMDEVMKNEGLAQ